MLDRRVFIGFTLLTTAIFIIKEGKIVKVASPLETIKKTLFDISPVDFDINSYGYLKNIILDHSKIDKKRKIYIIEGSIKLNQTAIELFDISYTELIRFKREEVLQRFSKTDFGDSWLYMMMSYLFEALFGDPIYGVNIDQKGWKWIGFEPGLPRPMKAFL
jgi:hypothetical protein